MSFLLTFQTARIGFNPAYAPLDILLVPSSAGYNVATNPPVEIAFFLQVFQTDVHPVSPVMLGVGGYIDALLIRRLAAQYAIDAH